MQDSLAAVGLALAVWVGLTLPGAVTEQPALDRREVLCEEAVARLSHCCPGIEAQVSCVYEPPSACENLDQSLPDVSIEESRCIRERSCEQIKAADICARVIAQDRSVDSGESHLGEPVCP